VTYRGRLQHLDEWYSTGGGQARERPKVRATQRYASPRSELAEQAQPTVFGAEDNWIILASSGENSDAHSPYRPDVLAFPRIAKSLRNALMKFAKDPPPEIITGHKLDGAPSESPHLAVVPLANVGWEYSDGALLGAGLVLPRGASPDQRGDVIAAIHSWLRDGGQVRLGREAVWVVNRSSESERASLRADRYCRVSRSWASVTPIFLDRFPKGTSATEEVELIVRACANIGLPQDELTEVEIHKHSAVRGAETTYPSRGQEHRPDWRFPETASYRNRPRRHVVLRFRMPVRGPILLGAGRYHGMGLFLPIPEVNGVSRGARA
jgi:CRISPR-associated protein Csb2